MKLRVLAIALALLASSSARAEGPGHVIGIAPGKLVPSRGGAKSCATVIPEDGNTVFHFYVCGGAILDTKGNVITENGVVPRVAKTGLGFPNGKSAEGAGPYSTSNFFSVANPTLNFGADFYITVLIDLGGTKGNGNDVVSTSSGSSGTQSTHRGYDLTVWFNSSSQSQIQPTVYSRTADGALTTSGALPNSTITIYSMGRAGASTWFTKTNTNATTQQTITPIIDPSSTASGIGYSTHGGTTPGGGTRDAFVGKVYEILGSTTTPSAAVLDALHNAIRN